jgi:hypothetical protein
MRLSTIPIAVQRAFAVASVALFLLVPCGELRMRYGLTRGAAISCSLSPPGLTNPPRASKV